MALPQIVFKILFYLYTGLVSKLQLFVYVVVMKIFNFLSEYAFLIKYTTMERLWTTNYVYIGRCKNHGKQNEPSFFVQFYFEL